MDARFRSFQSIRIIVVYRAPNRSSFDLFFEEFSNLIEQTADSPGSLLIVVDFNFHIDDDENLQARRFMEVLESYNLKQWITEATHVNGHTLDLVITKSDDALVGGVSILDPAISDHSSVKVNLLIQKPQFKKKVVKYRKLHSIDFDAFCHDITNSTLLKEPSGDLIALVDQYESVLHSLLDFHAPTKQRVIALRPSAP